MPGKARGIFRICFYSESFSTVHCPFLSQKLISPTDPRQFTLAYTILSSNFKNVVWRNCYNDMNLKNNIFICSGSLKVFVVIFQII